MQMNRPALMTSLLLLSVCAVRAQQPQAKALINEAVQTELQSDKTDHTAFQYLDHDITPDHDTLVYSVETPQGTLSRQMQSHGEPLSPAARAADDASIKKLMQDSAAMSKQRQNSGHDDNQAETMLKLLPNAFLWTEVERRGELVKLDFKPDPAYSPNSLEARVFAAMAGDVVLNTRVHRIYAMHGHLLDDVKFGFGIFGRLKKGGTFEIQRREVVPGHWQLTESHVHLDGKALFFKNIGSQEDEVRSDFKVSNAQTLQQAYELLPKP